MAEFPKNLAKALFAIQGEVSGVVKDSTNPHFKNRYASLESVRRASTAYTVDLRTLETV